MFCVKCGKSLPGQYNLCHDCTLEPRDGTRHCPSCGAENPKAVQRCAACGTRMPKQKQLRRAPTVQARRRKKAAMLAFFLGVFGVQDRYLGFHKRGNRRMIQFILSVAAMIVLLIALRVDFSNAIVNGGQWNTAYADSHAVLWFLLAGLFAAGLISALWVWITSLIHGVQLQVDAEGNLLE